MKYDNLIQFIISLKITKWHLFTFVELIIIAVLLKIIFSKKKNEEIILDKHILDAKHTELDMDNVIDSIFNAPKLYDTLKRKIHPDRFPNDDEKINIANELATKLNQYKNDLKMLNEIKIEAENKLKITI